MYKVGRYFSFFIVLAVVLSLGVAAAMAGAVEADDPACNCGTICVNTTGWWSNGGSFNASSTPIQDAVNNASGGDVICVGNGVYNESVNVNTAYLTIRSQNGAANCIVSTPNPTYNVFYVSANWVNITGLTIQNAAGSNMAGILLDGADYCNISGNNVTNNDYGVYPHSSFNTTIASNNFFNCSGGDADIYCYNTGYTTISNNTFFGNGGPDYAVQTNNES